MIDKGQIAEMGSHSELLAHNGVYKRLVLRQLTSGEVTRDDVQEVKGDKIEMEHSEKSNSAETETHNGNERSVEGYVNQAFHNDSNDPSIL